MLATKENKKFYINIYYIFFIKGQSCECALYENTLIHQFGEKEGNRIS